MKVINTHNQSYLELVIQSRHDLPGQLCTFIYALSTLANDENLRGLTGCFWWRRNWYWVCLGPYCRGLYRGWWCDYSPCSFTISICGGGGGGFWGIFGSLCLPLSSLFMLGLNGCFTAICTFYLGCTFVCGCATGLVLGLLSFPVVNGTVISLPMGLSTCISTSWSTDLQIQSVIQWKHILENKNEEEEQQCKEGNSMVVLENYIISSQFT